jgi:hypothetical protein
MLWHDSLGTGGTELSNVSRGRWGEPIHSKIRRMVVVKVFHGASWCWSVVPAICANNLNFDLLMMYVLQSYQHLPSPGSNQKGPVPEGH